MKFSGNMCLKIILKITKKPRLHPLFRRYIFRRTTKEGGGGGDQIDPPVFLGVRFEHYEGGCFLLNSELSRNG